MLILPENAMREEHEQAKKGLRDEFNRQLEKILSENSKHDKYWVLGKVKFPPELGGKVGRVFLQGCLEKPPVVADSFVYEIDSRSGSKSLLWIMNPNGDLRMPTLNKTVSVRDKKSGVLV